MYVFVAIVTRNNKKGAISLFADRTKGNRLDPDGCGPHTDGTSSGRADSAGRRDAGRLACQPAVNTLFRTARMEAGA